MIYNFYIRKYDCCTIIAIEIVINDSNLPSIYYQEECNTLLLLYTNVDLFHFFPLRFFGLMRVFFILTGVYREHGPGPLWIASTPVVVTGVDISCLFR